jgi:hypothetical protein
VPDRPRPQLPAQLKELRVPFGRRAVVIGAGSFGTAVAVLLARGGLRTTLQTRSADQARRLQADRENLVYLPGVDFPRELRVAHLDDGLARAEYVFLGVPSQGMDEVIGGLRGAGLGPRAALVSLAKGLVPPDGRAPTVLLRELFGEGPRGVPGRPGARERDGPRGRGPGGRLLQRGARRRARPGLHPRGRRLRAERRPGRRGARGRRQERRRPGGGGDGAPRAERRRAPRPGTSSRRSGATRPRRARARSR